jgi:hypothetical protein
MVELADTADLKSAGGKIPREGSNPSTPTKSNIRKGVRVVYGAGLENQRALKGSVGSNPTPSASTGMWWNWQTRWSQKSVVIIPYRFESDYPHQIKQKTTY